MNKFLVISGIVLILVWGVLGIVYVTYKKDSVDTASEIIETHDIPFATSTQEVTPSTTLPVKVIEENNVTTTETAIQDVSDKVIVEPSSTSPVIKEAVQAVPQKVQQIRNNAKLLFASGFESGVSLLPPKPDEEGVWWQDIVGGDTDAFFWPARLHGYPGQLQLLVDFDRDISKYIQNTIVTMDDAHGLKTKALHQNIIRKQYEHTQDPFIIYTENTEVEDLYIKYSLRYPENLSKLLEDDGWVVLTEFKTTDDYRLALYVYKENGKLYWYMHGDNVAGDTDAPYEEYWFEENRAIPVPVGKWFDVEIAWHRSIDDSGWVDWKVDGQTISHYKGPTKLKDPINAVMVFTNYASGPLEQWIDNIEIWDKIPVK